MAPVEILSTSPTKSYRVLDVVSCQYAGGGKAYGEAVECLRLAATRLGADAIFEINMEMIVGARVVGRQAYGTAEWGKPIRFELTPIEKSKAIGVVDYLKHVNLAFHAIAIKFE